MFAGTSKERVDRKKEKMEYLRQEEMFLTPILNSRKANMIEVYKRKM